jgi:cardiolipin synthase A/B
MFEVHPFLYPTFLVIYYSIVIKVFFTILLENKHPLKTQSYLLLITLLPIVGLVIYFYFGVNYRKEKMFSRKKVFEQKILKEWISEHRERLLQNKSFYKDLMQEKAKIAFLGFANELSIFTNNNTVEILHNGENKFPRLLKELEQAKQNIHVEYYMINDDEIGNQFIDILCRKSKSRVKVRLIFDPVGSRVSRAMLAKMQDAGIEVFKFMPVLLTRFANKINYRDHRKIVVIDGNIGYVGGMNVADHYINGTGKTFWRDTHLRIEGDAVNTLQMLFLLSWYFVSGQLLKLDTKVFNVSSRGRSGVFMGILGSSPDSDSESMMEAYFSMITNARDEVLISTPYFIPNESILTALKTAAKSGVTVKIIMPKKADSFFVNAASQTFIEDLVEQGIEVYLYEKGVIHSKVIIVDESLCTIGSANMDYRSFEQNSEVNAFIYNHSLAFELKRQFEDDLLCSKIVTIDLWRKRPFIKKLVGSFARVVAPLL